MERLCLLFVMRDRILFNVISQLMPDNSLKYQTINDREIQEYTKTLLLYGQKIDAIVIDEHYHDNITSLSETIKSIRQTPGCEKAPLILMLYPYTEHSQTWDFDTEKKQIEQELGEHTISAFLNRSLRNPVGLHGFGALLLARIKDETQV